MFFLFCSLRKCCRKAQSVKHLRASVSQAIKNLNTFGHEPVVDCRSPEEHQSIHNQHKPAAPQETYGESAKIHHTVAEAQHDRMLVAPRRFCHFQPVESRLTQIELLTAYSQSKEYRIRTVSAQGKGCKLGPAASTESGEVVTLLRCRRTQDAQKKCLYETLEPLNSAFGCEHPPAEKLRHDLRSRQQCKLSPNTHATRIEI